VCKDFVCCTFGLKVWFIKMIERNISVHFKEHFIKMLMTIVTFLIATVGGCIWNHNYESGKNKVRVSPIPGNVHTDLRTL